MIAHARFLAQESVGKLPLQGSLKGAKRVMPSNTHNWWVCKNSVGVSYLPREIIMLETGVN